MQHIHMLPTIPNVGWRVTCALAILWTLSAASAQVPTQLPDPDGKPGDATRPVQVYILAGQSNMVGMGDVRGARNPYQGVFLTADPAVPKGPLQVHKVGKYKVAHLPVFSPGDQATTQPVARGEVEVPPGRYRVHCDRPGVTIEIAGRTAGSEAIELRGARRYPFAIAGYEGAPPRFWLEQTDLLGHGDLEAVVRREGKFPWLVDGQGAWTVRQDVYYQEARIAKDGKGSPLSPTSNGRSIGPELGFGYVLGTFHDEQVLLIKTAMGNRSLGFDFRPPSSGRTDPDNKWESLEYRLMVSGVRKTLDNIAKVVPGYRGQGYELAGFVWFQGHKDSGSEEAIASYEKHLVHLIRDVRKEFAVPELPVVVATVGFGGRAMAEKFRRIHAAQMAVGDPRKHPAFAGNVASVDTVDFWREVDVSPRSQDYHYNRNAETYLLIGDAMGRAMVRLRGGAAAPGPDLRPARPRAAARAPEPPRDQKAAQAALAPILLGGVAANYVADPRRREALQQEARGVPPKRANQFLRGAMFGLVNCYRAAGIDDYDWHRFGPDLDAGDWEYLSFDPKEAPPKARGNRYRKVSYPEGSADWTAPAFDAGAAGWKRGPQPFGQLDGKRAPLRANCTASFCRCGEAPKTLWDKEVLLVRRTVKVPAPKPGHRYRLVVGGSAHVNSGEGFALWINGKLLAESKVGVARRQGGQPRGAHIHREFLPALQGGEVTIAAMSFLRHNNPRQGPPRGHLSLRLEEQKIPPLAR